MCNEELRRMMKKNQIFMWQVADRLGIHESTLIKKFRHEFSDDDKARVSVAVNEIISERQRE